MRRNDSGAPMQGSHDCASLISTFSISHDDNPDGNGRGQGGLS
jgi:hypothetical protein